MANITISPNMGMPIPVVGVDPGVDWANNVNACLSIIDQHAHSNGQGVVVTPGGININSNLPFNGFGASSLGQAAFSPLGSTLATSILTTLYVAGSDLYFNDGSGNVVRLTQGGSVPGATGTITGLPSGTASASYSAGTFSFQSATNVAATMNIGTLVQTAASNKTVTVAPPSGLGASYAMTWLTALPGATSVMTLDTGGQIGATTAPSLSAVTISGVTFQCARFSGTLGPSGSAALGLSFTTLLGGFGVSSTSGVLTTLGPMTASYAATSSIFFRSVSGAISVVNNDPSNSNVYSVIFFYV